MRENEPCGCQHDGHKWTRFCEAHAAELAAHKRQAQADYERTVNGQLYPVVQETADTAWLEG